MVEIKMPLEVLLIAAGVIAIIVLLLYMKERKVLRKYHELLGERERIGKLSKQVQLDYYKRRLTEDTLRKVLEDYRSKMITINDEIESIEKKHGIMKTGFERHQEEKELEEQKSAGKTDEKSTKDSVS
jgi:hypothetical protein